MGHQLLGDPFSEFRIKPASDVDRRQFIVLALAVCFQLLALKFEVGLFGVCLGVNRHVLPGGHRHGPSHQTCNRGGQYARVGGMRSGHAQHQTGS
jgi:hypothetical protein